MTNGCGGGGWGAGAGQLASQSTQEHAGSFSWKHPQKKKIECCEFLLYNTDFHISNILVL